MKNFINRLFDHTTRMCEDYLVYHNPDTDTVMYVFLKWEYVFGVFREEAETETEKQAAEEAYRCNQELARRMVVQIGREAFEPEFCREWLGMK